MIIVILLTLLAVYMTERKQLKQASRLTRWISYGALLLGGGIWYMVSNNYDLPHLSVWMHAMLKSFSPIQ